MIIAHRGASHELPENTLPAFQRAIELNCDYIELDVRLSSDNRLLCHHDALPNVCGPEIPTLESVLQLNFGKTGLMIELKEGHEGLAERVTPLVKQYPQLRVVLGSFSIPIMRSLSANWPPKQLVGIIDDLHLLPEQLIFSPATLAIERPLATASLVEGLKQKGIHTWVFTVDDPAVARALIQIGVDGIITNEPRKLKAEIRSKDSVQ